MSASIPVLHQDARLIVVAKPARMMTVPAPAGKARDKGKPLLQRLLEEGHQVFAVHRLDYETSGVVLFARDEEMREELMSLFKAKKVQKSYVALLQGRLEKKSGLIDMPIRDLGATARVDRQGEAALTRWEKLREVGPCSLVRVWPETGRHNQIRLHFAALGLPIVGERKFAQGKHDPVGHRRCMLHAQSLKLRPPHLEHDLRIKVDPPEDFEEGLERAAALPAGSRRQFARRPRR